jgi:hypothetical protein
LIQAGLLGGVFVGVLSALPIINFANVCCCMWIIVGGMLAAYLDQAPGRPAAVSRGALDGLLAGIAGAFVWLVVAIPVDVVLGPLQEGLVSYVVETSADMPPEVREFFDSWVESMREGGTGPLRYVVGFMFQLIAGVIFGTLGGLLGATFFWREGVPPALGGPPPPPPLPPQ